MKSRDSEHHRLDAHQKVTGSARYSVDVRLPGMLHAAVVRSPHPHARVASVDAAAALEVPGVVAVLMAEDAADVRWYDEGVGLFPDVVRYVGDEVAAIAATSLAAARRGARAVVVDYEPLPHVTDAPSALRDDAPAVHDGGNQVGEAEVTERGDVDAAMGEAHVIVDREFRTPAAVHNALEPHACTAWWSEDQLTLWASTQSVNDVREMVADSLGMRHDEVRVVAEHIGGGFGAKQVPWKDTVIAALLSKKTGAPVQLAYDRRGENLAAGKRNASWQHVRLASDSDGRLTGIDVQIVTDNGAYGVSGEASNVSGSYQRLYRCENTRTVHRRAYTNTGPAVAFRAPGYVEAAFALESAMDELARLLEIDPVDLRRRNLADFDQENDRPWSSPEATGRCIDCAVEVFGWHDREPRADDGGSTVRRGRGFAVHEWMAGKPSPPGYASVEMNGDGSVHVGTAVQDIGTGTRTALTQIASEELGVEVARIRLTVGDTAAGSAAPASAGSATLPTMGPAVRSACADLCRNLVEAAAAHLDVDPADVHFDGAKFRIDELGLVLQLEDLLELHAPAGFHGHGECTDVRDDVTIRTSGAAAAEVSVDTRTGVVTVDRIVVAPDCGRIVNPKLVDSQVIGGATQGIGFALTEEQVIDHRIGAVVNPDLEDYLVPTIADTCVIEHAAVDLPDLAANPLGIKGIGEPPLIGVPAAIANAVADAIGVRPIQLPLTRRRILDALRGGDPS